MIGADKTILALDISSTVGWAEGPVSGHPMIFGRERLAPEGAGDAAIFAGMLQFLGRRLAALKPRIIVYEAPLDPRILTKTTRATLRRLNGLPAVAEAIAYRMGVYDIREIETGDLKMYWHGKRNLPRAVVKPMTIRKMRALGYDVQDEDAADAIAVHRYLAAYLDPAYRNEALASSRGGA
jgi:hypothetical protein